MDPLPCSITLRKIHYSWVCCLLVCRRSPECADHSALMDSRTSLAGFLSGIPDLFAKDRVYYSIWVWKQTCAASISQLASLCRWKRDAFECHMHRLWSGPLGPWLYFGCSRTRQFFFRGRALGVGSKRPEHLWTSLFSSGPFFRQYLWAFAACRGYSVVGARTTSRTRWRRGTTSQHCVNDLDPK